MPLFTPITLGVIADTHIPDRVRQLHPSIMPIFRAAEVSAILHAGDIAIRSVLTELAQIAPVTAVRGNRDLAFLHLPLVQELTFNGVGVALMHGHGGLRGYLRDKMQYYRSGYKLDRYLPLMDVLPQAQIVIFGHTHFPLIHWQDGRLLFNPGSASFGMGRSYLPNIGLITIDAEGGIYPKTLPLEGYKNIQGRWQAVPDVEQHG